MVYCNFIILFVLAALIQNIDLQKNPEWKDPSVMNRGYNEEAPIKHQEKETDTKLTPLSNLNEVTEEDHVSTMIFRRVLKFLFNQDKFEPDSHSDQFIRRLPLKVSADQFKALKKADIRDLDDVMNEIFVQSQEQFTDSPIEIAFAEIYVDRLLNIIKSIFTSSFFIFLSVVLSIWIFHKFFNVSKLTFSMVIVSAFVIMFGISYYVNYMDCLNDLEAQYLIDMESASDVNNPCADYAKETDSFFKTIKSWVVRSSKQDCDDHKKKVYTSSKRYCDPAMVLISWIARLQSVYIEQFTKNFIKMVDEITKSSGFLSKIISFIIIGIISVIILLTTIKSVMKYGFQSIVSYVVAPKNPAPTSNTNTNNMALNHEQFQQLVNNLPVRQRSALRIQTKSSSSSTKSSSSSSRAPTFKMYQFGSKNRIQNKKKNHLHSLKQKSEEDSP